MTDERIYKPEKKSDPSRQAKEPVALDDGPTIAVVTEMNQNYAVVLVGGKAMILYEKDNGEIVFMSVESFRLMFSNRFVLHTWTPKKGRDLNFSEVWLDHPHRRQFDGVVFDPVGDGDGSFNLWRGWSVEPAPGDCSIFLDHVRTNICQESEELYNFVMGFAADMVQNPASKPGVSLALRGEQGTGKTKYGEVIGSLFDRHYCLVDDPRYITGNFNAHMESCLLLQADEGFWAGDKQAEGRLKGLVTSNVQMIERKGIDPIPVKNYVRLLITTNTTWVVPAAYEERRFCVLDVGNLCKQNRQYFKELDDQLDNGGREALLEYLLEFDLSKVNLRNIPATGALLEQKLENMPPVHKWWFECLQRETVMPYAAAWEEWIAIMRMHNSYLKWCDNQNIRHKITNSELGREMVKRLIAKSDIDSKIFKRTKKWISENADEPGAKKQVPGYTLPVLESCRAHFSAMVGHEIDWGDGD